MPSIYKDNSFDIYRIRGGHSDWEWATIAIRSWQSVPSALTGNQSYECGEIMIYSSFGSWAHQWGNMGVPLRRFLIGVEFGYLFTKLMGEEFRVFDGDASMDGMRERLIEWRKNGEFDRVTARALWAEFDALESQAIGSDRDFVEIMQQISRHVREEFSIDTDMPALHPLKKSSARHFLEQPWEHIRKKNAPPAVGFWRDIWPVFIEHLKTEETAKCS